MQNKFNDLLSYTWKKYLILAVALRYFYSLGEYPFANFKVAKSFPSSLCLLCLLQLKVDKTIISNTIEKFFFRRNRSFSGLMNRHK